MYQICMYFADRTNLTIFFHSYSFSVTSITVSFTSCIYILMKNWYVVWICVCTLVWMLDVYLHHLSFASRACWILFCTLLWWIPGKHFDVQRIYSCDARPPRRPSIHHTPTACCYWTIHRCRIRMSGNAVSSPTINAVKASWYDL